MSLRDALLKAGAVNKNQKREAERDLKKNRKKKQGERERAKVVKRREQEAARLARQEKESAYVAARKRREGESAAAAAQLRVRHLIQAHGVQVKGGKGTRFYFPMLDGVTIGRLIVPWSVARSLRAGQSAIAALVLPYDDEVDYRIVPRAVAEDIRRVAARQIVFFNETAGDEPFTDDL